MKKLLVLLSCAVAFGCQSGAAGGGANGKFVAAQLDTLPLLQADPEYQKMSQSYVKENLALSKRLSEQVKRGEITQEEAAPLYLKEQQKLNQKWMNATNNFIQTRHGKMRQVVKQMCEEKGIDIVLIHSKAYPTVAYGALDITQDVGMKIFGGPGGASPTPGGTPK